MPLSEELRRFWYERDATKKARRTSWGMVFADPRFPLIYDANRAGVLEDVPGLALEDIRTELAPALQFAGSPHEHIEFWAAQEATAVEQIRSEGAEENHDVVMVFDRPAPFLPSIDVDVHEVLEPDEEFLQFYRESRSDFGERAEYTEEVVEQLYRRDLEEFVPRGMRFFVCVVDGGPAGVATLQSMAGVGYVNTVATVPRFRRRGVATAMVTKAIEESRSSGDGLVHLLAEEGGAPQRLYERLGFRVVWKVVSFTHPSAPPRP